MATPILPLALGGTRLADGTVNSSGYVYCYQPGTLTQATVYTDADALEAHSQPVMLGAWGQAAIFTDDVVDLYVYDADGVHLSTMLRANAVHSGQVDVESAGFTGVNAAGQTVASGLGSLQDLETKAKTSFNGTDFKYLASTSATERLLYSVIRERGISVKDYNAAGDGLTIDTVAFTDAIAVLKAAGGGVLYVPPGTYILDAALTIDFSGLLIIGAGINVSILKSRSTSADVITVTGSYNFDCMNLQITAENDSTGTALNSKGQGCVYRNLKITDKFASCITLDAVSFSVEISHCNLQAQAANKHCLLIKGNGTKAIDVFGTYFEGDGSSAGIGVEINGAGPVASVDIHNNYFGVLATGFKIDATATGYGYRLSSNYMRACTTGITVGLVAGPIGLRTVMNDFGAALIDDNQNVDLASASKLTWDGSPLHRVTGTTTVNHITKAPKGTHVTLLFNASLTVTHSAGAVPADALAILLSGAADFSATQTDTLQLVCDGGRWVEVSRTVI